MTHTKTVRQWKGVIKSKEGNSEVPKDIAFADNVAICIESKEPGENNVLYVGWRNVS